LMMTPKPNLVITEEILSEPKKILFNFFRLALNNKNDELKKFLEDERNKKIVRSYDKVVLSTLHGTLESLTT
ncbi:MAG: hypothetical protein QXF40_04020, partial [Metallosphaera sp.]